MQEIWRQIPGYEGFYDVSNIGRVRSLDRLIEFKASNRSSGFVGKFNGKIRENNLTKCGYFDVLLTNKDKISKHALVHRLVAIAFLGNPKLHAQVNHIDGKKLNNKLSNLEWCTASENVMHAHRNGLAKSKKGEAHYKSKLKSDDVIEIRSLLASRVSQRKIANKFSVSQRAIAAISTGETWSHIK